MTRTQAKKLQQALTEKFGGKTEFEPVDKQGRYRFAVVSQKFRKVPHLKRQDQIWDVVDGILPREATMDISMILAYDPADVATAK